VNSKAFTVDALPADEKPKIETNYNQSDYNAWINNKLNDGSTLDVSKYFKTGGPNPPDKSKINQTSNWPTILTPPSRRSRRGGSGLENTKFGMKGIYIVKENYSNEAKDFIFAPCLETDWNFERRHGTDLRGDFYLDVANEGDFAKKNDFSELYGQGGYSFWRLVPALDLELFSDYGITNVYRGIESKSIGLTVEGRIGAALEKGLKLGDGEIDASLELFKLFGSGESFDFNIDPELRIVASYPFGDFKISGEAKLHHPASTDQNTGYIVLMYNPEGSRYKRGLSLSNFYAEVGSGVFQNDRDKGVLLVYLGTGIKF
jgi:hypothetical protein